MGVWSTKSIATLQADPTPDGGAPTFSRRLGPVDLCALGIGAIIGAGIFIRTGTASAQYAGPAVVLSFIVAGIGCLFVGLCFAELASMLPITGGPYTYCYAAFGELIGWLIGWVLMLEYLLGAATVAVSWSGYFVALMKDWGISISPSLIQAPFIAESGFQLRRLPGAVVNLPAVALVVLLTVVLACGIRASAIANRALVIVKVAIILLIVGVGFLYLNPANWHPFVPPNGGSFGRFGWSGILQGAVAVFFAFIGFDAVTIASQEARSPQRDLPIGILGSLAICTTLYVLMALVMTGLTRFPDLNVPHPLVVAMETVGPAFRWVGPLINVAIVFGLASVGLVLLMGQPRLIHAMSRDGLLPRSFGRVDPRVRIPFGATIATGIVGSMVAGVFPMGLILEAVSVATLIAFVGVCAAVMVLRYREPTARRPFRAPLVPLVPGLGIVFSMGTLMGIPTESWTPMAVWFAIGLVVYGVMRVRRTENRREVIVRVE